MEKKKGLEKTNKSVRYPLLEFLIDHDQLSIFAGIKVNYIFSTLSDSCYFYEIRIGMAQFRTQSSSLLVFRLSYQKKKMLIRMS